MEENPIPQRYGKQKSNDDRSKSNHTGVRKRGPVKGDRAEVRYQPDITSPIQGTRRAIREINAGAAIAGRCRAAQSLDQRGWPQEPGC